MKIVLMSLVAVLCLTGLFAIAEEAAVEPAKTAVKAADVVKVAGLVKVEKNEEGVVTAVMVQPVEGAAVAVAHDEAGKKLAALAGKNVEVKGMLKDGTLCVVACKVVKEVKETE